MPTGGEFFYFYLHLIIKRITFESSKKQKTNKEMKKEVMQSAWALVKSAGLTISEALKKSWKAIKLKFAMKVKKVAFSFKKKDGSIREAFGTLAKEFFNYEPKGANRENFGVVKYFDLEAGGFRSFKIENVL